MLKETNGGGGGGRPAGSIANLAVTPEQRRKNLQKAGATRRRNRDSKWREIYERYISQGLANTSFDRASAVLGISSHTIRRIVQWAKEQK